MTEHILPDDLANGLVDGTAPAASIPEHFRAAADLLSATHQPASAAELAGMDEAVRLFTSTISSASGRTKSHTSGVTSMFTARLTKRTAAVVFATLLTAGTAAAAAGGVIPTPFTSPSDDISTTLADITSTSADAATSSSLDDAAAAVTSSSVDDHGVDPAVESEADITHDQCEAVTKGTATDADQASLRSQAAAMGVTLDAFCMLADAANGEHGTEIEAGDDHGAGDAAGHDAGDDHGAGDAAGHDGGSPSSVAGQRGDHGADDHGSGDTHTSVPVASAPTASDPTTSNAPSTSVRAGDTGKGDTGKGGTGKGGKGADDRTHG